MSKTTSEFAERLFKTVATIRAFELALQESIAQSGFLGVWHPGLGQEGMHAGAISAMGPEDYVFYTHRGVGHGIARGIPLVEIFGDLFGKSIGSARGKGGGIQHYADPSLGVMGHSGVLGGAFVVGAGAALTAKITNSGRVAVSFFGDGASSRGTFHEAMLQSAIWKLPLVLICENNGYALSTAFERSSPTPNVADRAAAYNVPGVVVDGQSPLEVHRVVSEAIARARAGEGPSLIECKTVRPRGHYEGDRQQYRIDNADKDAFTDPLDVLRAELDPGRAAEIEEQARAEVLAAREEALAAADPDASVIYDDIYAP